ncbi:MAG TPA: NADH-quinone oxidoreductase subunit NuoH [Gemmatimonadaceae bacterium]|jgi:NADH-quinone oxidoreductase subunit H|nr:NADH-quinone oxidoreductase subunit NuoH [Gemmatimonadaceae bacterium]
MTVLALLQAATTGDGLVHASQPESGGVWFLATVIKMLLTFTIYMIGVMLVIWAERRICGFIQDRLGPNRVGPAGLLQSVADGVKNIMKEETYPGQAYLPLFVLAPVMAFIPALLTWSVIPYGAPWQSKWGLIDTALAPMPIGFLFILSIASLGVYGIVLAGWSSNNKYSLLGGLRSSAQMISYEISMGMSTIPVLILAGNVSLSRIVEQQGGWGIHWNVVNVTIAFVVFMIAAFAETNRVPFDLPEAESELVAGYHAEYSAMKFSMFFIAEYANIMTASALMATLFFGGWDIPFTMWDNIAPHTFAKTLATFAFFWVKILFFVFVFIWVRWTLPRFRYDQLMALGWKFMLPVALGYVVVVAGATLILESAGIHPASWQFALIMLAINVVLVAVMFGIVDRGRLISPAYSRLDKRDLRKLRRLDAARMRPITSEGGAD